LRSRKNSADAMLGKNGEGKKKEAGNEATVQDTKQKTSCSGVGRV